MNPGLIKTYTAGAAVNPRRFVKMSASYTVVQAASSNDVVLGVSGSLAAESGGRVEVTQSEIAQIELGGTVARGSWVGPDSVGRAVAVAGLNNGGGIALESGVVGDWVDVMVLPQRNELLVAEVTVTSAQLLALNATPISIIAAPGAGKAIVLSHAVLFMDYNTTAYDGIASGEDLAFKYTNSSGATLATVETTGFLDQSADAVRYVYPTTTAAFTPAANAAVVLHMLTGEIATGNSPLLIRAHYRVIDTSW